MSTLIKVSNLISLIEEAVRSGDPRGAEALVEWTTLGHAFAHLDHVLCHIDPAVIEQAVRDVQACDSSHKPSEGGGNSALH